MEDNAYSKTLREHGDECSRAVLTTVVHRALLAQVRTEVVDPHDLPGIPHICKKLASSGEVLTTVSTGSIWGGGIGNFLTTAKVPGGVGIVKISVKPEIFESLYILDLTRSLLGEAEESAGKARKELEDAEEKLSGVRAALDWVSSQSTGEGPTKK